MKITVKPPYSALLWFWLGLAAAPGVIAQGNWTDKSLHKTEFIKVNNVRLHYLDWGGKGDTILFLHGLGDSAHIFDDLAPKFTNQFRVLGLTRIAAVGSSSKVSEAVKVLPDSARSKAEDYVERVTQLQKQQIERFRKEVPNGRVIEFTNTDHYCFIQRENEVVREMQKFLAP